MNDVYLITTASDESATDGTLDRFLMSALASPAAQVICVARRWRRETSREIGARYGSTQLTLIESEANLPLSQARNIALRQMARLKPEQGSVVAFPDDDCWYLPDTLARVEAAFRERPDAAAVVGCYGPGEEAIDRARFPARPGDLRASVAVRRVSSVTMFVGTGHALRIGGFNPALGAGTAIMAGEDIDYVLRLIEAGLVVAYRPEVVVGHAYTVSTSKSYAGAFVLVLASHLFRSPQLGLTLIRGLVGSTRARHRLNGARRLHALKYLNPVRIRAVVRARESIEV